MKLSRTATYAVQAALLLAESSPDSPVPCRELASRGAMPERFLLQILRNLVTHGIARSTRGVDGGYALARSPDSISLLELIEAVSGPLDSETVECAALDPECQQRLSTALAKIAVDSRKQLEAIKLTQLLRGPAPPGQG